MKENGIAPRETEYFLYLPEGLYRNPGWLERRLGWLPLGGQYAVFGTRSSTVGESR